MSSPTARVSAGPPCPVLRSHQCRSLPILRRVGHPRWYRGGSRRIRGSNRGDPGLHAGPHAELVEQCVHFVDGFQYRHTVARRPKGGRGAACQPAGSVVALGTCVHTSAYAGRPFADAPNPGAWRLRRDGHRPIAMEQADRRAQGGERIRRQARERRILRERQGTGDGMTRGCFRAWQGRHTHVRPHPPSIQPRRRLALRAVTSRRLCRWARMCDGRPFPLKPSTPTLPALRWRPLMVRCLFFARECLLTGAWALNPPRSSNPWAGSGFGPAGCSRSTAAAPA